MRRLLTAVWVPCVVSAITVPAPITVGASQQWQGNDGGWSTFPVRIGNPQQLVFVIPSTSSTTTWAVADQGCTAGVNLTNCPDARGGNFNINASTSWQDKGLMNLGVDTTLGFGEDGGDYGLDQLGLGMPNSGGPTVNSTLVTAIATFDFYLGIFGLNPRSTNLTDYTNTYPSFMSMLFGANVIPSLSYTYTAGAQYRPTKPLGTLILGGYDESIIYGDTLSFIFFSDYSRDLSVGIQAVAATYTENNALKTASLLPNPVLSFIDSTTAQIWLPVEACKVFEQTFGLVFDPATELYLVDSNLHAKLLAMNPSVSFILGQTTSGGATINITLPYSAFDLSVTYPIVQTGSSNYFPLRRAANDSQYVLGRTFLQEAVITADYGRNNFSLSSRNWALDPQPHIVTILPVGANATNTTSQNPSSSKKKKSLSLGALIGIAVGVVTLTLLSVGCIAWYFHRKKKKQWQTTTKEVHAQVLAQQDEKDRNVVRDHFQRTGSTSTATGHSAATYEKPWGSTMNSSATELPSPDRYAPTGDRYPLIGNQYVQPPEQYAQPNNQYAHSVDQYAQSNDQYSQPSERYAHSADGYSQTGTGNTAAYFGDLGTVRELDGVESVPLAELEAPEVLHELGESPHTAHSTHNSMRKSLGLLHSMGFGRNREPQQQQASLRPPQQHDERQPWYSWVRGDDRASKSRWGRRSQASNNGNKSPYGNSRPPTGSSSYYTSTEPMTGLPNPISSVYTPLEKTLSSAYSPLPPMRGKQEDELSPLSPLKNVCYKNSVLDRKREHEREQRDQWEREQREWNRQAGGGGSDGYDAAMKGFI